MSQEFHSTHGGSLNPQSSISDEIDAIYESQAAVSSGDNLQAEQIFNIESKRLYGLADEIRSARAYRLETQFLSHDEKQRNFIGSVAEVIFNRAIPIRRTEPITEADLRSQESTLGATIFGELKPGERREFFYDKRIADRDSWFFHQEIAGQEVTLHYEVHPGGVLRISSNPNTKNEFISGQELNDFLSATHIYHGLVMSQMYSTDGYSGKKAA